MRDPLVESLKIFLNNIALFLQEVFKLIAVWVFSHYISTLPSHQPMSFLSCLKMEAFKSMSALSSGSILKGFHLIMSCKNNSFLSHFFAIPTVTSAAVITHIVHLLQTSPKHINSVVREKQFWLIPNDLKAIPNSHALPLCDHRQPVVGLFPISARLGTREPQNSAAMFCQ